MGEEWIREREQYVHRSRCLEGRQYKWELSEVILEREAGARWWCRQQMFSIFLITVPQFCSDAKEKNHDWSKPAQEISFPFGQQCRWHCLKGVIIIRTEWLLRAPWHRDRNGVMRPGKLATYAVSHSWWQSRPRAQTNWSQPRIQHTRGYERAHVSL